MKSFRQLINEALGLFESNFAARQDMVNVGREIARATANKRANNTSVSNDTPNTDIILDTDDNLNKIFSRLTPEQRGDLIGDCINTYRDFSGANYISVFVENGRNANYFISNISNKEIIKEDKTGYDNIIISRNYINKHFPIVNARNVLLQIIRDLKSGKSAYEFASYADPMPHDVTKDMITNHKVFDEEVTTTFNRETRLKETKRTKKDSGKTEDVIGLTLGTEMSGGGIGKKEGVMSKTSQGRKTGVVSNVYYVNQNPDCCVQVEGLPIYVFSLKRSKNMMFESINLEKYLIEASSVTTTSGSVKNVYIRKKLDYKTIFTHSKFLSHLAKTINLAIRNPKTLIKSAPVNNNSHAEELIKSTSADNNSSTGYSEPTIDELIKISRKAYNAFEAAHPDNKERLKKEYLEVANTLYKKLIKEYGKNGMFGISDDIWQRLTDPIKKGIKGYQAKYKAAQAAKRKAQATRRDTMSAFGRRY